MTPDEMKQLRERKRLSVKDMATLLGVTRQVIYNWESGQQVPQHPAVILYRLMASGKLTTDDIREVS